MPPKGKGGAPPQETQSPPSAGFFTRTRGRKLQRLRRRFLAEHPLCALCEAAGKVVEAVELDHVVPLFKGGTDEASNLQALCLACHRSKTIDDLGHRQPRKIGPDGFPV